MTHILVDTANTFFRARHVIRGDTSEKVGMAIHIMMNSVKKAWQDFGGTHVIFCLEGRSFRKDMYAPYKRNRKEMADAMTEKEKEENEVFWEVYDDFVDFVKTKTNATVLRNNRTEADDLIARWIDKHPEQNHVIISTDKDLNQLITPKVKQYNGVNETTMTHEGWFDSKGNPVIDKKLKAPKPAPDTEWLIFEKSMRGDPSDNIFQCIPRCAYKGHKEQDRITRSISRISNEKGYTWNNLMLSKWVDHEGNEHRVMEDYERNRALVDLHAQPEAIVEELDQTIAQAKAENKSIDQVGIRFMRFCGKYDLNRISEQAQLYVEPFNARLTSMTVRAKTLVKDKFWIVEQNGQKLGTLQKQADNGWIFLSKQDSRQVFHTQESLFTKFGFGIFDDSNVTTENRKTRYRQTTLTYMDFPCSQHPYNPMFDVQNQLPVYTKTPKSKSQFVQVTT